MDKRLLERISFTKEKLAELNVIAKIYEGKEKFPEKNKIKKFGLNTEVKEKIQISNIL